MQIDFLYSVCRSGLGAVTIHKVVKETPKTFVLDNGKVVRKNDMCTSKIRYFIDENSAITYQNNIQYNCRF